MHRPQSGSTGSGPSPVTSSTGSVSGGLFPNDFEGRHMEVTSHLAKLQDVSARQTGPAMCASNMAAEKLAAKQDHAAEYNVLATE